MAHVLSTSASSSVPLKGDEDLTRSPDSAASIRSTGTTQHNRLRSISTSSLSSLGSYFVPSFRRNTTETTSTPRSTSSVILNLNKIRIPFSDRRGSSVADSRRASLTSSVVSSRLRADSLADASQRPLKLVDVVESEHERTRISLDSLTESAIAPLPDSDSEEQGEMFAHNIGSHILETSASDCNISSNAAEQRQGVAFKKWVNKLRIKRHPPLQCTSPRRERWTLDDFDHKPPGSPRSPRVQRRLSMHRKSDSQNSSLRFITSMKSATATVASASIATISRRTTQWRRGQQRSSVLSGSEPRPSVDSIRSVIDEAARHRSRKRREKLEELIRTEESYVADIRALSNAYFTILSHQPTATSFLRPAAQKVIADLLHLHDDILGQLHRVVPFAEYDQSTSGAPGEFASRSHNRWHSVDVVPPRTRPTRAVLATIRQGRRSLNISRSSEDDHAVLRCGPQVVTAVVKVFAKHIDRFVVYEDYGANYDLVQRDIEETQRNIATWADFDKAIEALSAHVNPIRSRAANHKRAMTVKDLLIKPIQRIPRYELLFADLKKMTPVCDDPDAHTAIGDLQVELNGICLRTNSAKDNPRRAKTLETSWLIADRLTFSGQVPKSVFLRLLGRVCVCGCLYIAYRGKERIKGRYMICILFESTLILATEEDDHPTYSVVAGIALANATIQETDNQKGLQCYTAPHSWKVVFEHAARMYELIFAACSAVEADVWRTRIGDGIKAQSEAVAGGRTNVFELQSPLTAEMKSIGNAFGKPGSFVRRMSVHRTATVGPSAELNQVIIKNTQGVKEVHENASQTSIHILRSQSLAIPSHVQALAPRRAERHRLEAILSDVWSKDLLPYPGMIRRSDPIRAGANHVIRKFSMASITSNFSSSKRTASYTSVGSWRKEDIAPSRATKSLRQESFTTAASRPLPPSPVNFHNAPDAFLPADFELGDAVKTRKKSALRTLTLSIERPFSPLLGNDAMKQFAVGRAQSVRDTGTDPSRPASSPIPPPPPPPPHETKRSEERTYRVVPPRAKTPATALVEVDAARRGRDPPRTPRKSKSRLLRLFH